MPPHDTLLAWSIIVPADRRRHHPPLPAAGGDLGGARRGRAGRARAAAAGRCADRHAQGHRRLSVPDRHDADRRARPAARACSTISPRFAVEHARGSPQRLFLLVYAVGTLVTVLLSNDATAIVLTPAVYAATPRPRAPRRCPISSSAPSSPMPRASCCRSRTRPISSCSASACRISPTGCASSPCPRSRPSSLTYVALRLTQRRALQRGKAADRRARRRICSRERPARRLRDRRPSRWCC